MEDWDNLTPIPQPKRSGLGILYAYAWRQFKRLAGEPNPKAPKSLKERLDAVAASYIKEKAQ